MALITKPWNITRARHASTLTEVTATSNTRVCKRRLPLEELWKQSIKRQQLRRSRQGSSANSRVPYQKL